MREVSDFLGFGVDWTVRATTVIAQVDRYVQSGYRQFLYPPGLPDPTTGQQQARHTWSFLKPTDTLTMTASATEQDLPDDFGGMDGDFTFTASDVLGDSIKVVGEQVIREKRQGVSNSDSGIPYLAAIRPKRSDGTHGQRFEVLFFPKPDSAYVVNYRYNALQAQLTTQRPWPLGGMVHSETLIESCLAKAEARGNDMAGGPHYQEFLKHLAASVAHDRSIRQPEHFGYCGDGSDMLEMGASRPDRSSWHVDYVPVP